MMKRIFFTVLIFVFVLSGCAWFKSKEEKPSQELARDGSAKRNGRNQVSIADTDTLQ